MKYILLIFIYLANSLLLANCGCLSAKQPAENVESITTIIEDSALSQSKNKILPIQANQTYTLYSNWDLKGETYVLPEGVTLKSRGGVFKNGTLIGKNTKIDSKNPLFEDVSIMGEWNVSEISTNLFTTLDYENSLRDVLALANPVVENNVIIEEHLYTVSAKSFQAALDICSNTILIINGTIQLLPNEYKGCYILQINGSENVVVKGSGCLIGDKNEHTGTEGEWGHGINILKSNNIFIEGLRVNNCWGDCIYVGNESSNIRIENCTLTNGRRQGISVTSADGVIINGCTITNVFGTAPQHGIDIEPNKGDSVNNIRIEKVAISNCYGGIMSWRPESASIGDIEIKKCSISNIQDPAPINMRFANKVSIEDCEIESKADRCISIQNVDTLSVSGNILKCEGNKPIITKNVNAQNIFERENESIISRILRIIKSLKAE